MDKFVLHYLWAYRVSYISQLLTAKVLVPEEFEHVLCLHLISHFHLMNIVQVLRLPRLLTVLNL